MFDLEKVFENFHISEAKREEIKKKTHIMKNMEKIFNNKNADNKLLYTLACTATKNTNLVITTRLIEEGMIEHETMLKGCIKYMDTNKNVTYDNLKSFVEKNKVTTEEIVELVRELLNSGVPKKQLPIKVKNAMPCADFKVVMDEVNKIVEEPIVEEKPKKVEETKNDWLEEGEIKKLHKPGENPQISEEIRLEHLKRTGGKVVTRFPPEPNGFLHIGHAKAINLNFEYAKKYDGYTYLRYDDTNPKNEDAEYFKSIHEDVTWLGFKPYKITASSDYFDKIIEFSFKLIKKGKAYVCHLNTEDMRKARRSYQDAKQNNSEVIPSLSPYRNRTIDENLKIFQEMLDGKWEEGKACLRFKMETDTKNPLMLDLVGIRIIDAVHPIKKIKFPVYPSYEFALCVSDSLEDVTHSFCTREFFTRQESYNWLLDQLEIYKPVQIEFSRLNVSNTVLSKRKILPLAKYGIELDDPRLYTIKGMRRRGFTPTAINNFCKSVGLTYSDTIIDVKQLENFVRDDLNKTARRIMCIKNPLKVFITNVEPYTISIPDFQGSPVTRDISFTQTIYIERSDFKENAEESFHRLTLNQPVGLLNLFPIKVTSVTDDGLIAEKCNEVPKKHIHWVGEDHVRVEMRNYSPLWEKFNPEEGDYLEEMNKNSLEISYGLCDKRIVNSKEGDKFQFQRIGYYCVDKDTTGQLIVVNLTIPLRNVV